MTEVNPASKLELRYFDMLVGVNPDNKRLGYQIKAGDQVPERTLLAVDAKAQQLRAAGAQAKAQFTEFAQAHLHDQVADELVRKLHNIDHVTASMFDPGDAFDLLIDALSVMVVSVLQLRSPRLPYRAPIRCWPTGLAVRTSRSRRVLRLSRPRS